MLLISGCTAVILFILDYGGKKFSFLLPNRTGLENRYRVCINRDTLLFFSAVLILVSTFRYGFIDTSAYKYLYQEVRFNIAFVFDGLWHVEPGWLFFMYVLNFFSASPKLMLFVSALLIISSYVIMIRDYSSDIVLSLLLFYCLMYLDTNNGLRQMVASAVIIWAYSFLMKEKYFLFVFLGLLAYQLHHSAVVCLLIVGAAIGAPLNLRVKGGLLLGLAFLFTPQVVSVFMKGAFSDSQYAFYLDMENGMSLPRAVISGIIPAVLSILYLKRCSDEHVQICKKEAFLLNITFLHSMFTLMGLYMQYWARFCFYTAFAPIVLLPKLACAFFDEDHYKRIVRNGMALLYTVYFAYNIYVNYTYGSLDAFYLDFSF